ncbi:hypothetical protein [Hymenobacter edaphi]|uniref:Uncharacterized protein n=1 Tax=Hymenobacter edaphi TaxID=2211146 RepID=A0A328BQ92_9BACT|nr:hypothetical protein [Hymenobacter edaphi]RAK68104.1 hypothetical protein DLM85_08690 [Hymenobacter edaphi]
MSRSVLDSTSSAPAWLRRLSYALCELILLLAYRTGSLMAWQRSLHGAGRQAWRPAPARRRYQLRAAA